MPRNNLTAIHKEDQDSLLNNWMNVRQDKTQLYLIILTLFKKKIIVQSIGLFFQYKKLLEWTLKKYIAFSIEHV